MGVVAGSRDEGLGGNNGVESERILGEEERRSGGVKVVRRL